MSFFVHCHYQFVLTVATVEPATTLLLSSSSCLYICIVTVAVALNAVVVVLALKSSSESSIAMAKLDSNSLFLAAPLVGTPAAGDSSLGVALIQDPRAECRVSSVECREN